MFKIFLTWQNDVPKKTNKDYIEGCVRYAVDTINKVAGRKVFSPPLLGGSTGGNFNPIESTILSEIMSADVLFADLTSTEHVDTNGKRKFQLNANVAYETGIFLGKKLCNLRDSLIAVNNEAWVPTSNSPFDFRGRSQIVYCRDENLCGTDLARCTSKLRKDIKTALYRFLETNKVPIIPNSKRGGDVAILRKILGALPFRAVDAVIKFGKTWVLPDYAFNLNDNFNMYYQLFAKKITDKKVRKALDDFSDALYRLFSYGSSFFPDIEDGYVCPETHRDHCDYQNAINSLEEKKDVLKKELERFFSKKELNALNDKSSRALIREAKAMREKISKGMV